MIKRLTRIDNSPHFASARTLGAKHLQDGYVFCTRINPIKNERRHEGMGTVKAGVLGGGAAILAVVVLAAALLRPHEATAHHEAAAPSPDAHAIQPSDASLQKPTSKSQNSNTPITLLGTLLPGAQATLSVRQPSRIMAVLVKEGQAVRKGQLLAQFDASDVVPQQQSAQAGVRAAETQVDKARAGRQAQARQSQLRHYERAGGRHAGPRQTPTGTIRCAVRAIPRP